MAKRETVSGSHWIPLSDMMMGLMMVFMLLAAVYMIRVDQTTTLVVREYEVTRSDLKRALQDSFAENFKEWDAELLGDMTIRFRNPDVLFATGSAQLNPKFAAILDEFIPRYVEILSREPFYSATKEVRIEGHTSAFWADAKNPLDAYMKNMALSQARTRSTLAYILGIEAIAPQRDWLIARLTANGLSSSRPIAAVAPTGSTTIDNLASQRVEFRIVTNAEDRMARIAEAIKR